MRESGASKRLIKDLRRKYFLFSIPAPLVTGSLP
jgi:hypothetical protein